uniref:Ig-like domain-containing protein n=1 Tax=Oreochromis aureus TaxID=47969 RepID=A0AAZ1X5H4_OREAU
SASSSGLSSAAASQITVTQGQITVTQPGAVSSAVGGSVSINCKTSHRVDDGEDQFWYQHRDGERPKLLTSYGNRKVSGIPDRFTSSGSNTDFTLTISGVQAEDAAVYYCMGEFNVNIINRGETASEGKLQDRKYLMPA